MNLNEIDKMTLEEKIEVVEKMKRGYLPMGAVASYHKMVKDKGLFYDVNYNPDLDIDLNACIFFDVGHFFDLTPTKFIVAHNYWGNAIARMLCGIDDFYMDEPVIAAALKNIKSYAKRRRALGIKVNLRGEIQIETPLPSDDDPELLSTYFLPVGAQDLLYRLSRQYARDASLETQNPENIISWDFKDKEDSST